MARQSCQSCQSCQTYTVRPQGFTYVGALYLLVLLLLAAAMASVLWRTQAQREREKELLFAGQQISSAIEQFQARRAPGTPRFPQTLQDLLRDPRALATVRDLRRLYADPMRFDAPPAAQSWALLRSRDGGIVGVHSLSSQVPIKRVGFAPGQAFEAARSYRDWRFIAPSAVGLVMAEEPGAEAAPPPNPGQPLTPPPQAPPPEEPTPADIPAPPAPRAVDYRNRSGDACQRINSYDRYLCALQARQFGAEAGRECNESAVARAVVCPFVNDGPLPPLYLRQK